MGKVGWASLNICLSIILAAVAFVFSTKHLAPLINSLYYFFTEVRNFFIEDSRGIPFSSDPMTKFLLEGELLIFVTYIIVIHIVLATLIALVQSLFSTR